MALLTVEKIAKIVGTPAETLLSQMNEAGLDHSSITDDVKDSDKKTLLEFLKNQQTKAGKTISLKKKKTTDFKNSNFLKYCCNYKKKSSTRQ